MLLGARAGADRADAVRVAGRSTSRESLFDAATALAGRLVGARAVALTATATLDTVVAVTAGLLAGVPVVPIPADAGPAERGHILRDSGADVVLDANDVDPAARSSTSRPEPEPSRTALILYTSGTTGAPKGVLLPHGAIAADLDALADGYLGREEATAAAFTDDGWFRTGDVASLDPDGGYRIVGRESTDLIKSGGHRIGAGEVEDALLAHPAVREAAVVGQPDDDLGHRVVAYCVADGVDERTVVEFVAARLSVHKRPRSVVFLPELPRNALGKVQKAQLPGRK